MKKLKGVLRGAKISNRHSTVIDAARPIVERTRKLPEVTKIVVSEIRPSGSKEMRLVLTPVPAGLRMVIRGPSAQQLFFIYTRDREKAMQTLLLAWETRR